MNLNISKVSILLLLCATALILLLSSCESRVDVSSDPIFSNYIGKKFSLKGGYTLREREKHKYVFIVNGIEPLSADSFFGKVLTELTEGTEVFISSIKVREVDSYVSVYAIGHIPSRQNMPFEVPLGGCYVGEDQLIHLRMPWESSSVPKKRTLPWSGCK